MMRAVGFSMLSAVPRAENPMRDNFFHNNFFLKIDLTCCYIKAKWKNKSFPLLHGKLYKLGAVPKSEQLPPFRVFNTIILFTLSL